MTTTSFKRRSMESLSLFGGMKIMIVEDQSDARAMIRNMLSELGITQIFESSSGRDALNFMDSAFDFINFIICDWNMPGMSGMEFVKQLRTVDPVFPILMISGRSDKESIIEAKRTGVTGYIRKPFSAAQLEAKLRIIGTKMSEEGRM